MAIIDAFNKSARFLKQVSTIDVGLSWFNDNVSLSFLIGKNLFNYGQVQTIIGPIDEILIAYKYFFSSPFIPEIKEKWRTNVS